MKYPMIALLLAGVVTLTACGSQTQSTAKQSDQSQSMSKTQTASTAQATKLTAKEAYTRMQDGGERIILDVRTAEEYAAGHIAGAVLLPNEDIGTNRPAQLPLLDTEIMIYCRSGNRSAQAAAKLVKMGYTHVYDFGGIQDWTYGTETGAWPTQAKKGTLQSFSSFDLAGVPVDETVFAGHKLTMVNIWGTFCGPCLNEMPELGKLAETYAGKGVQILGIVMDVPQQGDGTFDLDQVQSARDLVKQTGANYRHLLPTSDLLKAKVSQVDAVPETIFVDANGNQVGKSYTGARSGDKWAAIIDGLLSEAAK